MAHSGNTMGGRVTPNAPWRRAAPLAVLCALAVTACLPAIRRLDEAALYDGPVFHLKVVRYRVRLFLSYDGETAYVTCASPATEGSPGGPTKDPGWVEVRYVPALGTPSAAELAPRAMEHIDIVADSVLIVSDRVLQASFDGCATFRRWDPRDLPDSVLVPPPPLPDYCTPKGTVDCTYLEHLIEVEYAGVRAATDGRVAFSVASARFPPGTRLHVESADSGRTWTERFASPSQPWSRHRDDTWGWQISYPASWRVTVADAAGSGAGSADDILLPGERAKVTFTETGDSIWPGRYQVLILDTGGKVDLSAVVAALDLADLWGGDPADTVLAAQPAKTWVRWEADSLVRETLALIPGGAILVRVDESAPNDPRFGEHRDIYQSMTIGLGLSTRPAA